MTLADQRADRSRGTSLARQRAPVVAIGKAVGSPHRVPQPVRMQELLERVRSTDVIILDARPTAEYHAGHIAGAISVPIDELQNRLRTLPAGREYVAYCRGPYCAYADRAVELLRQSRRRAQRLLEGFPEWRAAGYPIARGDERTAAARRRRLRRSAPAAGQATQTRRGKPKPVSLRPNH